jgi:hypothetical protein
VVTSKGGQCRTAPHVRIVDGVEVGRYYAMARLLSLFVENSTRMLRGWVEILSPCPRLLGRGLRRLVA